MRAVLGAAMETPWGDPDGFFREDLLEDPRLEFDLARAEGRVASAMVTWRDGEIVYLTGMATAPGFQQRGIGRALLQSVLLRHRARGARMCHLVASDAGAKLYRKAGFELLAEHPIWSIGAKPL
jgi:ribosomal protein S18 acetylase RimI-like enzyme